MTDRLQHADAEYALLVRLVLEPELIGDVVGQLDIQDFSVDLHGKVFGVIVSRYMENKITDSVVIQTETGMEFDPMTLQSGVHAPVSTYIDSIKDAAIRRALTGILDRTRQKLVASNAEPFGVVEAAVESIIQQHGTAQTSAVAVAEDYRKSVNERKTSHGGITYGLKALDDILMPVGPGRLIMLAARPSVGKTAMAELIADHWAKHGPVLFASFEMSSEELMDRAMSRDTGIPLEDIIRGKVPLETLEAAINARSEGNIHYLAPRNAGTSSAVRAEAARIKLTNKGLLAGVVIDYIQLLADEGNNEVYRIGNISHSAKRMANALGCPVLALVQFSRAIESGDKPRSPRLSDMRDSGILEADADVVIALVGDPAGELRELHVLKQRQGRLGKATLYFDGSVQRWRNQRDEMEW